MLNRLVHKADFERLLATRSRLRSAHFALHHVPERPAAPARPAAKAKTGELSTGSVSKPAEPVDDFLQGQWLGCVVPKRHARRSVTRSLLKRQMRCTFERHAQGLPAGLWLLRLSQGFPVAQFVSAHSKVLADAARGELERLLSGLQSRPSPASSAVEPVEQVAAVSPPGKPC